MHEIKYRYVEFDETILKDWIDNGVKYVKMLEVEVSGPYEAYELVPNSEMPETGEIIHSIHSEEVADLLIKMASIKFLVHEVYLEEFD